MTTRIAPGVGANLLGQHSAERNQDATTYVGNLDPQVLLSLPSLLLLFLSLISLSEVLLALVSYLGFPELFIFYGACSRYCL